MQHATIHNRSLSGKEKESLKQNARQIGQLRVERRSAAPGRRAAIDAEIRKLNNSCEAIIEPGA